MEKAYNILAKFYDKLQEDIDYDVWIKWPHLNNNFSVLEIGCGTGVVASELVNKVQRYDAFDLSEEMIKIAKEKNDKVNFFVDNMITYNTQKKYDTILCFMDTVNYLTEEKFIDLFFQNVSQMLEKDGIFYFDIHQETNLYNFDGYLESGFINKNSYRWYSHITDEEKGLVNHDFTFVVDGEKYVESHTQKIKDYHYYTAIFSSYFDVKKMFVDEYRIYFELIKK